jgi:hypothetical protein
MNSFAQGKSVQTVLIVTQSILNLFPSILAHIVAGKENDWSQPQSGLILVATSPEQSPKVLDHKKLVHSSPVQFFPYLGIW